MFTWSMPFDYNMTRIKQQPIFVHQEMRLPKSWKGFGDLTQFNATVNGQPLSGRSLAIDPFSFPNDTVVHYLVNTNDIIKIAKVFNPDHTKYAVADGASKSINTTALMNFALTPFTGITQISTSSDIPTNTGSIHAALSWSPNPLAPNTQSTLNISFYDSTGTAPLTNTNVKYNKAESASKECCWYRNSCVPSSTNLSHARANNRVTYYYCCICCHCCHYYCCNSREIKA
jgi:hypothetical protein